MKLLIKKFTNYKKFFFFKLKLYFPNSKIKNFSKLNNFLIKYEFNNNYIYDCSLARFNQYFVMGIQKVDNLVYRYFAGSKTLIKNILLLDKNKTIIIDIGSNIGEFSKFFFDRNYKNIIAIEPSEECIYALKKNIPNLQLHKVALSNINKKGFFYYNSYWTRDNSLNNNNLNINFTYKKKSIIIKKLSSILKKENFLNKTVIVKIDCEGNEFKALKGFGNLLKFISYILVDIGESEDDKKNLENIRILLKDYKMIKKYYSNVVFINKFYKKNQ